MIPDSDRGGASPESGLYNNTDPLEVIYLIQPTPGTNHIRYYYESSIIISTNGMHFVRVNNLYFAYAHLTRNTLLEFFSSGAVVKSYRISELVKDLNSLDRSMPIASMRFDESSNIVYVTTADNRNYRFDIATGENLDSASLDSASSIILFAYLAVVLILCAAIVTIIVVKRKKRYKQL
jgi:hypothetical protein